ncbi:MAG: SMP-30/gluconolactonase/LRE family protein [SAR202 cluster bacterium]|nr:SMP-30/gluconolactonase/LRE family protein [SAR202 cluster bacterium]
MQATSVFQQDLGEPEAPVLLADGRWAVVEMSPENGCVSVISLDGLAKNIVARTGRPNGMVVDSHGTLWVAESMNPPSLKKVELNGSVEVILTGGDGVDFLFPNDVAFGPDGALYMTDSGVSRPVFQEAREKGHSYPEIDGKVFRIDLTNRNATILDDGLPFANGLAFGLDNALYVTATITGLVYRYEWNGNGTLGPREVFTDLVDRNRQSAFTGGDGLAVGSNGFLYCAVVGQGDVTVVDTDGLVVNRIIVGGEQPTNVAFGPRDSGDLYVTVKDAGTLERCQVGVSGLPLHLQA